MEVGGAGPAAGRVLIVGADDDVAFGELEMALDEREPEGLAGIVPHEERGEERFWMCSSRTGSLSAPSRRQL